MSRDKGSLPLSPRSSWSKRTGQVGFALFFAAFLTACQDDLYTGLTQRSANEMIAVLAENGIKASRSAGDTANTYKIRVANDDLPQAVRVLKAAGHPKDSFRSIGEIFPGDGIIVTPYEQRARMSFALGQELSKTISDIDGVVSARVHIMLAEGDTRNSGRILPPSASVVVHQTGQLDPNDLSQRVRLIVSNAVTNLPQRSVAVSVFQARGQSDAGMAPLASQRTSQPAGMFEVKSPFGFTLWILAALALVGGFLLFSQRRKQAK
jgi:type III secretion protein J